MGLALATPYYRAMINGSIKVGLNAAADKVIMSALQKQAEEKAKSDG